MEEYMRAYQITLHPAALLNISPILRALHTPGLRTLHMQALSKRTLLTLTRTLLLLSLPRQAATLRMTLLFLSMTLLPL